MKGAPLPRLQSPLLDSEPSIGRSFLVDYFSILLVFLTTTKGIFKDLGHSPSEILTIAPMDLKWIISLPGRSFKGVAADAILLNHSQAYDLKPRTEL